MAASICAVESVQAQARRGDVITRIAVEGTNRIDPETVVPGLFVFLGISQALQSLVVAYVTVPGELYLRLAPFYAVALPVGTVLMGWLPARTFQASTKIFAT